MLQTLERGLALLEWVASSPDDATASKAGSVLGLPRSTGYHLVNTLVKAGYLRKERHGELRLGLAVGSLVAAFARQARPERELLPVATSLHSITGETTFLAIRDGLDAVTVFSAEGAQHLRISGVLPGFRGFMYCRGAGKAILAYMSKEDLDRYLADNPLVARTPYSITDPEVLREQLAAIALSGVSYDNEEFELNARGIAVPFFGSEGDVVGAIAIGAFAGRLDDTLLNFIRRHLLEAGEQASRLLGYAGAYPVVRAEAVRTAPLTPAR